jgi:hypothetical protein
VAHHRGMNVGDSHSFARLACSFTRAASESLASILARYGVTRTPRAERFPES